MAAAGSCRSHLLPHILAAADDPDQIKAELWWSVKDRNKLQTKLSLGTITVFALLAVAIAAIGCTSVDENDWGEAVILCLGIILTGVILVFLLSFLFLMQTQRNQCKQEALIGRRIC
jgi:cytochrome c biogenesis protein CcdA